MPVSFRHLVDKSYEPRAVTEVLAASPAAIQGISSGDAGLLKAAFGIDTVEEMARSKFFAVAHALAAAAGAPAYDPGPPLSWEVLFDAAPLTHYRAHASGRFRLHFGPVFYRGRLDGTVRVLVVGQDPGTDELLGHRALVGQSGQRVQRLLAKLGITRSYVMVNAFLFGVFGQFDTALRAISEEPPILDWRNRVLDNIKLGNRLEAVLAFGAAARHAVEHWPGGAGMTNFTLTHPSAPEAGVLADWNHELPSMLAAVAPDDDTTPDPAPYGTAFGPADAIDIPRFDLPFGTPAWHGTGGTTRSMRDGNSKLVWTAAAP